MTELQKLAKNAAMLGGAHYSDRPTNGRKYSTNLNYQFFARDTREYANEIGPLASNCYDTASQGIDTDDWYKYVPVRIRVAAAAQSLTGQTMLDDWKKIFIIAPANIDYISQGAYMEFDNNVWIAYKPKNVSSVLANTIVRRCNAVINVLDYYGNIVAIPMSYSHMETQGNAPQVTENVILSKNYIACICQYNEYSKHFTENSRLILGDTAYAMRGVDNFTREFTYEPDSVHLMSFTIERTESLEQDNLELQCADYYSFRWDIFADAQRSMRTGAEQQIVVRSVRNGETVVSTDEHPITYLYESTDDSVVSVDNDGYITANGVGSADIVVTLKENQKIKQTFTVEVTASAGDYIEFSATMPTTLKTYEKLSVSATYFEDGVATDMPVEFSFSGAAVGAYSVTEDDYNTVTVTCYRAANIPLTIKASTNGKEISAEVRLTH